MVQHLRFPTAYLADDRRWDLDAIEDWFKWRELSRLSPIRSERTLRWLILRVVGRRSSGSIGQVLGVPGRDVERQSVHLVVHLVSRIPYEVQQQWAHSRKMGSTDLHIATQAGVGVTLVRLTLDGIPRPLTGGRVKPYLLQQLWHEGLPIPVIAQQVGRTVVRTAKDIAARFGWTRTNVRGRRQLPHFPDPDGHEGGAAIAKGTWWWATTIDQWEAGVRLRTCRICGARMQRLGTHHVEKQPRLHNCQRETLHRSAHVHLACTVATTRSTRGRSTFALLRLAHSLEAFDYERGELPTDITVLNRALETGQESHPGFHTVQSNSPTSDGLRSAT